MKVIFQRENFTERGASYTKTKAGMKDLSKTGITTVMVCIHGATETAILVSIQKEKKMDTES
jgi:hypothetical protein